MFMKNINIMKMSKRILSLFFKYQGWWKRKKRGNEKKQEGLLSELGQAGRNNWNQAKIGLEYKPQLSGSTKTTRTS